MARAVKTPARATRFPGPGFSAMRWLPKPDSRNFRLLTETLGRFAPDVNLDA
ncbi:hypothetical protein Aca07nite_46500 [Actinoplanes capillaceus]|uniref:Uncharacterized protein n=1 Tax=Actinoplanes campanulatus TaxID=113559 RepID=A0ABQ3WM85_9ACTN|nr:hypothetical protein Aca07nite_46500 [Actinoplanes capillaceus]